MKDPVHSIFYHQCCATQPPTLPSPNYKLGLLYFTSTNYFRVYGLVPVDCQPSFILFSQCDGIITDHDSHDTMFGGRKVYVACLGLWIVSFMALLPDIMGVKLSKHLDIM